MTICTRAGFTATDVARTTVLTGLIALACVAGLATGVFAVAAVAQPPVAVAPASDLIYEPPVAAPVTDPFRPPETFAGAGNRGLEYGVAPGTPIRASADGVVVFSGQVGGQLFITVSHADGVRTSYAYLGDRHVEVGDRVTRGQVIALSGATFHFGARVGDAYLDPETLFAASGGAGSAVLGAEPVAAGRAVLIAT